MDLRALAADVVSRLAETEMLGNVTVAISGEGSASGSSQKLRQVVLNLIKNAAEAAAPDGHVDVDVADADGFGSLVVRDSGMGLSREALDRVFEPFFTNKAKGTGLGLAVSKGIIQAHGGSIQATNMPLGGARFEVRLPATAAGERA